MNDLVYNVNSKNGVVECTVQNCRRDFMRIAQKVIAQYPENIRYFYNFIAAYHCGNTIKDEYVGVAKCSNEDVFNEMYGKDVARTKAIIKREDAYNMTLAAIYSDIVDLMNINLSIDRSGILSKHCDNFVEMMETGKTVAQLYGYDDKCYGVDFTPHYCSLCHKEFLNYKDDIDYLTNEFSWELFKTANGSVAEVCPHCLKTIKSLS